MPRRRKTFSGGEAEANEFIRSIAEAFDGQRATFLALQTQVALGLRLGIPKALGITDIEYRDQCYEAHGGTIRLSIEKRREAVARLTAPVEDGGEGLSQREAAAVLGVHQGTVHNDLRAADETDEISSLPEVASDEDSSVISGSGQTCAECGTATLPNWVHEEDEFTGRLLCGRCAERAAGIRVVEPDVQNGTVAEHEDEKEIEEASSIDGREVWQAFIDLSAFREVAIPDVVQSLPVDRLDYVMPVIEALREWLPQVAEGVRQRIDLLPVALPEARFKRDRRKGRLWHAPA